MSKKVKVIVSVLIAVALLTVGGVTTVMAHGKETAQTPEPGTTALMATANTTGLLPRVAQILGISEETLTNAAKQARQEMRDEAISNWLAKAVEKGRLTQEKANAIKAWWEQRPAVLDSGSLLPALGTPFMGGRQMRGLVATTNVTGLLPRVAQILGISEETLTNAVKQARQEMRDEAISNRLAKAVEKGLIDEDEADAIKEWWGQRPEVLDSGSFPGVFGAPALRGWPRLPEPAD
jgi:predicted DNA-binding protein (UPF0251 family)